MSVSQHLVARPDDARWVRGHDGRNHKARPSTRVALCGASFLYTVSERNGPPTEDKCGECVITDMADTGQIRLKMPLGRDVPTTR